jgi:tetratricopeptide (TPR) repeat protein
MKRFVAAVLLFIPILISTSFNGRAQDEARASWQVTNFDVTANIQLADRTLNANAILNMKNVGRGSGTSLLFRINAKASIKSVTVGGATASFRVSPESRGSLQRVTITLPSATAPNSSISVNVSYTLPVESNTGLAAISPINSQFLPLSFWYPASSTPFTVRGADMAPYRLTVSGANVISSGVEKSANVFDQTLNGQPFFVQGDWDRIEGSADGKGITAYVPKGSGADERKLAESMIGLAGSARTFLAGLLGPAPDVPIRLVSVRRGSGFSDSGTVLIEAGAFQRAKLDAATAMLISEAMVRLWIGGQTSVHGEASGILRDGLVRYLATLIIEKQFGRDAALAEMQRERMAYAGVAKRDAPLSKTTPGDDTYFGSVPNKGAMVWRLVDRKLGRDAFMSTLKSQLLAAKDDINGFNAARFRAALFERGGQGMQSLLEQQFDQVTDMDLMVGLPIQRGSDWVSALRNLGSTDAAVTVVATNEQGQQISVEATVPAKNFSEAVFKMVSKPIRVEIDPEKLYPQLDYSNDVVPRGRDLVEALGDATRQFGSQDFARAESIAREIISIAPRLQEARVILGRALLGQNKNDEAEKVFRAELDETLPTSLTLAWSNIGLAEIALKRGQAAEAAKRFNDAVHADAEYAASLAARAGRIRAEAGAAPPVDQSAQAFIAQLDQAITGGKKPDLDAKVISGELVRFVNSIAGTPTELWQTRVLRTEMLDANLLAADVSIRAKQLGQEQSGTAVLILSRSGNSWKLAGIELFEVH